MSFTLFLLLPKLPNTKYLKRLCHQNQATSCDCVYNMTQYQKVRKWGVRFLTVNKICFKHFVLLLLCVYCAFIIGQYHSGNNMSSKSGTAGEILFFESEKCHEIRPLKTDTLKVSTFDAFIHVHDESKHYLSHRFAQRRYRFTQFI